MDRPPPPPAREPPAVLHRRRAAESARRTLLALVALPALVAGWRRAADAVPRPPARPAPATVDLALDPAWRLALLPGIGRRRANDIVWDRARHGPPAQVDDLLRIPSIGAGTLAGVRAARSVRVLLGGRPVGCPRAARPDP